MDVRALDRAKVNRSSGDEVESQLFCGSIEEFLSTALLLISHIPLVLRCYCAVAHGEAEHRLLETKRQQRPVRAMMGP